MSNETALIVALVMLVIALVASGITIYYLIGRWLFWMEKAAYWERRCFEPPIPIVLDGLVKRDVL